MIPKVKGSNVLRFKRYTYAQAHITFYSCTTLCLRPNYQLYFWVIAHYCQMGYGVSNSGMLNQINFTNKMNVLAGNWFIL